MPTLKRDDVVIIDNLTAHHVAGVRETIEVAGATLGYLPQYSPDLDPIDMALAKLKALLRNSPLSTIYSPITPSTDPPLASRRLSRSDSVLCREAHGAVLTD